MGKISTGGRLVGRWLDVKNIEGGYGSVKIIHGIDMYVDEGEFVTIIGPNGCGKSTLIKIIFGIATHYGGVVEHKGEDVSGWRTDTLATRGIAYVPQVDNVFPSLSVEENLQMGGNSLSTSILQGKLWFTADDGIHGRELWTTDGTQEGTYMFIDLKDGSDPSYPNIHFSTDDYFYFTAREGDNQALFMSDGKQVVMDLEIDDSGNVYLDSYDGSGLVHYDGEIYLNMYTSTTGNELWKLDGTSDGIVMVHEFRDGSSSGSPYDFTIIDNVLYFRAYDGSSNTAMQIYAYSPYDYEI